MLCCSLIVRAHLRLRIDAQPSSASPTLVSLFPLSHPLSSNSLRIISFADPHSLNPAESHRYKNVHGRGYLQLADLASFKIPSRIHLFFQSLAQCPSCNSFVLMVFHFHGGCVYPARRSDFQRFDVSDLSPLFSQRFALFCTHQNLNPFVLKRFRTLCQKPPGVGYPLSFWNCQVVHASQRTEQPRFSTSHPPSLPQPGRGLVFFNFQL